MKLGTNLQKAEDPSLNSILSCKEQQGGSNEGHKNQKWNQ